MLVGIGTPLQGVSFESILDLWVRADELGFDSAWVGDHLYPLSGMGPFGGAPDDPVFEAWTVLGALAVSTKRIRLGTMVSSNTFRHPGLLAKMAATLDVVSGGRITVGLGAGYYESDHTAYGLEFGSASDRSARLAEACEIVIGLLSRDRFSFAGSHYSLTNAPLNPRPLQLPHPPLLIGGAGERYTLPIVARYADAWDLPSGTSGITPASFRAKHEVLKALCTTIGRDHREITTSIALFVLVDENRRVAFERRRRLADTLEMDVDMAARHVLAGDPGQIISLFRAYEEAGVDQFVVAAHAADNASDLDLIGREVLPALSTT